MFVDPCGSSNKAKVTILETLFGDLGKCFTYVTITIANLTTYSRKPGNYNGTIIFEIDTMKNSFPLNSKFTFFAMSKPNLQFFSAGLTALSAQLQSKLKKKKKHLLKSQVGQRFKLIGDEFFMMSISKIMVPL